MQYIKETLYVGLGGAIGASLRYWIGFFAKSSIQSFPWPTLLINAVGSALLGAFAAAALTKGWGWQGRLFFAVGVCGGFTTFSTFSYEVIDLFYERSWRVAGAYAVLSFILSVGCCFAGGHFARLAFQGRDSIALEKNPFARE